MDFVITYDPTDGDATRDGHINAQYKLLLDDFMRHVVFRPYNEYLGIKTATRALVTRVQLGVAEGDFGEHRVFVRMGVNGEFMPVNRFGALMPHVLEDPTYDIYEKLARTALKKKKAEREATLESMREALQDRPF